MPLPYRTVIATTDFSEKSAFALRAAAKLAVTRATDLTIVHVVDDLSEGSAWLLLVETPAEIHADLERTALEQLETFCQKHVATYLPADRIHLCVRFGEAVDEILAVADETDAELIVTGSLGHGPVLSIFLGSTANQLVRQSTRPVLVVPETRTPPNFDTILAPVDPSELSRKSLAHAVQLARASGGEVVAMNVLMAPGGVGDPAFPVYIGPDSLDKLRREREGWLDGLIAEMGIEDVVSEAIVLSGDVASGITMISDQVGADLIVMGSHGRRGLRRFLLGNTAERILRRVPCPVLIIQSPDDTASVGDLTLSAPEPA